MLLEVDVPRPAWIESMFLAASSGPVTRVRGGGEGLVWRCRQWFQQSSADDHSATRATTNAPRAGVLSQKEKQQSNGSNGATHAYRKGRAGRPTQWPRARQRPHGKKAKKLPAFHPFPLAWTEAVTACTQGSRPISDAGPATEV